MAPHQEDQFELKTLKVSAETRSQLRKPFVWNKPSPKLYDYHYEIGGLYYQPMIRYILDKSHHGQRATIEIPDRIQSDYDRRAYKLRPDSVDLGEFLSESYRKRAKDINSKRIHVANELYRKSKASTQLNTIRGAAIDRDKYLCKLQLYYTEKVVKESEDEALNQFLEDRNAVDGRYDPAYVKVKPCTRDILQQTKLSEILESEWKGDLDRIKSDSTREYHKFLANNTKELFGSEKKYTKTVRTIDEDGTETILTITEPLKSTGGSACFQTSLTEVKKQVEDAALDKGGFKARESDITFRGRLKEEGVGLVEKAALMADRFKPRAVPDIPVAI